jgi:glycosyltransferase involved in cell wall biosynthesis
MRLAFGESACILVLADKFRHQLIEMGISGDKISTITTMFDGKQIESVRDSPNTGGQKILFLSRFIREKGMFELVEAFTRITHDFPDARMVMAGDGPARDELEQAITAAGLEDKITLPGYVRDQDKAAVLADADIFVLPSYSEGCPVSMLEAMAAGQALVSTPVGGIPDILHDGKNGVLIDSAEPDLIYDALHKLMSSPELVRTISETNKEVAWRCYEAGVITGKIEEYYRKALL